MELTVDPRQPAAAVAESPGWNLAVHRVDQLPIEGDRIRCAVTLQPDAYGGDDLPRRIDITVANGGWSADPDAAGRVREEVVDEAADQLHLTLRQFMSIGRKDFRDLRINLDPASRRAQAVTFHQELQGVVAAGIGRFELSQRQMKLDLRISYPGWQPENIPARTFEIHIDATCIADRLIGEWTANGPDANCSGPLAGTTSQVPQPCAVSSPGILIGPADCQRIGSRLEEGAAPETAAMAKLRAVALDYLSHEPQPVVCFHDDTHHSRGGQAGALKESAEAVYALSLLTLLDDDAQAGSKAGSILDAWSSTLTGIDRSNPNKAISLYTSYLWPACVWAADHLRQAGATFDGDALGRVLGEIVLPVVRPTLYRNNWTCWAICCQTSIACFLGDGQELAVALDRWRDLLPEYVSSPAGQTKETLRDLWHTQMGLAPLACVAEMAWKQGIDLYSAQDNRLLAGVELHAPWALGDLDDWPFEKDARAVGQIWPYYELVENHYSRRMGLATPRIDRVLEATRPEGFDRMGLFSLTHGS
ncbi:MAG: alginate lyase family protein [Planctomycetota bacterium]